MPVFEVGCLRVTHPFAAGALLHPLDLHVLGTPPAFILSQDQTLRNNFFSPFQVLFIIYGVSKRGLSVFPTTLQLLKFCFCLLFAFSPQGQFRRRFPLSFALTPLVGIIGSLLCLLASAGSAFTFSCY